MNKLIIDSAAYELLQNKINMLAVNPFLLPIPKSI
jgi:hypothetical protein